MAVGFNPAAEMSMIRAQQSAQSGTATATSTSRASLAMDPAAQATMAAAAPGAAGEAAIGAAGVMPEPPNTGRMILQSALKGASTGAMVALGVKQFGPLLAKVPFIAKAGGAAAGFLTKLPLVGSVAGKALGLLGKSGLGGFAIAGLMGAAVGAIGGAIKGVSDARKATAEYNEALAAQQQAIGDPLNQPGVVDPVPADAGKEAPPAKKAAPKGKASGRKFKSWVTAETGHTKRMGAAAMKGGSGPTVMVEVKQGDTLTALAKRYHTSIDAIMDVNQGRISDPDRIYAGKQIAIPRSMIG